MKTKIKYEKAPEGIWPVMLTPFTSDLKIDWKGLDALTDWYIEAGVAGLFACCLSSEMYQLTHEERIKLIKHVIKRADGRVPVAATGTFSTDNKVNHETVKEVAGLGVASLVIITSLAAAAPDNSAMTTDKLLSLAESAGAVQSGLYECPLPYKKLLSLDTLKELADSGRYSFFKDTCCDAAILENRCRVVRGSNLGIFNAHSPLGLFSLRAGGAGLSNIASNFVPQLFVKLMKLHKKGSPEAEKLQETLTELDKLFAEAYPESAKYFLKISGLPIETVCRTPCPKPTESIKRQLHWLKDRLVEDKELSGIYETNTIK